MIRQSTAAILPVVLLAVCVAASAWAHPMTYQGTVLAAEPARVGVKTINDQTKKEDRIWFVVDKNTRVKRGEKTVAYADAKITIGERIVVTVDMDATTTMLATEIRLGDKP